MSRPLAIGLGAYPIDMPRHGGQRRVSALVRAYEREGVDYRYAPIFSARSFPQARPARPFLRVDDRLLYERELAGGHPDVEMADVARQSPGYEELIDELARLEPVSVHLEQPYLFPLFEDLLQRMSRRPHLVYSSQNVESRLLEDVIPATRPGREGQLVRVRELEARVLREAWVTLAVSSADTAELVGRGARDVLLAPNGSESARSTPEARRRWQELAQGRLWALFVGSAHPPNLTGFVEMLGWGFGFVPPDAVVAVLGGVAEWVVPPDRRFSRQLEWRTIRVPDPDDDLLAAAIEGARCLLLPITCGGGTCIKTAQALLSDRPIVATTRAFLGYEPYRNALGVTIRDQREGFRTAVRDHLDVQPPPTADRGPVVDELRWERTLAPAAANLAERLRLGTGADAPAPGGPLDWVGRRRSAR